MQDIYIVADNLISALGFSSAENMAALKQEDSGIRRIDDRVFSPIPFYGSFIDQLRLKDEFSAVADSEAYTRLEQYFILSIGKALEQTDVKLSDKRTLLLLSTTKGNIDLMGADSKFAANRITLGELGLVVGAYFKAANTPLVLSNACISGVLAQVMAGRYIRSGLYDHVVVAGGDLMSRFVVSGFQVLKAMSEAPCRPYDEGRNGINLGEACGTIVFSKQPNEFSQTGNIRLLDGASSNDANHISGPSRTGDGLYLAVKKALKSSGMEADEIDYINAHGTATRYNDEMESKAFARLNLLKTPLHSLKGYFGHTLGAAGVIESIVAMHALEQNLLLPSIGFEEMGISEPLNIIRKSQKHEIRTCLKTASGFGGCNAAVIFKKS